MPKGGAGNDCSATDDLNQAFATFITAGHLQVAPACLGIGQALGQGCLPLADHRRPPDSSRLAARRRVEQPCVGTQAGDHADAPLPRSAGQWRQSCCRPPR